MHGCLIFECGRWPMHSSNIAQNYCIRCRALEPKGRDNYLRIIPPSVGTTGSGKLVEESLDYAGSTLRKDDSCGSKPFFSGASCDMSLVHQFCVTRARFGSAQKGSLSGNSQSNVTTDPHFRVSMSNWHMGVPEDTPTTSQSW